MLCFSSLLPGLHGHAGAGSIRLRHPLRVWYLQSEDCQRLAGTFANSSHPFSFCSVLQWPPLACGQGLTKACPVYEQQCLELFINWVFEPITCCQMCFHFLLLVLTVGL